MDKTVPCNSVNAGNLIFIQCIFAIFSEFCPTYTHSDFLKCKQHCHDNTFKCTTLIQPAKSKMCHVKNRCLAELFCHDLAHNHLLFLSYCLYTTHATSFAQEKDLCEQRNDNYGPFFY